VTTVIARQTTKAVVPLMLLVSINLFLQGHNLPGGGFIAGIMTASAIALLYVIFNFEGIKSLRGKEGEEDYSLIEEYTAISEVGLVFAAGTGFIALELGLRFLSHRKGLLHLPLFGEIHWTTAMIFDLGVYLVVVGAALIIVEVLGRE
jgi:multicomponent Na+:H+ antiporter subunit B